MESFEPMTDGPANGVATALELLDRWRHFPSYQLERRADIFFALYVPGIIEHALGIEVNPRVIPEFPIKREESRKSKKVDYFLISKDRSRVLLVELKTDMGSRDVEQDDYLTLAKDRGLHLLLSHIPLMAEGSDQKAKYIHLLGELEQLGLVSIPDDLRGFCSRKSKSGIKVRLRRVRPLCGDAPIEVVYIQPRDDERDGERVISFQWIADYLQTLEDPLARRFAMYVERWIEPAASRAPAPLVNDDVKPRPRA